MVIIKIIPLKRNDMKALWNGQKLAESDETIVVEGNHYFPASSIDHAYFEDSNYHTSCPWKGEASYYTLVVNGEKNENSAWYYPKIKSKANAIENYVAFWKGVDVVE
jgi:uncharacterized protein (DUF427 family)